MERQEKEDILKALVKLVLIQSRRGETLSIPEFGALSDALW